MKQRYNVKRNILFLEYSFLSLCILAVIFCDFIVEGKTLLGSGDAFQQHYLILYDFHEGVRNAIKQGDWSNIFYNWHIGLGADMMGQYGYYITGDIFSYLSLPFSDKYLPIIYSVLILMRIYCTGLSFCYFMCWRQKNKMITLVGALAYMCSAFVMYASIIHPYFTNAAIIFPLFIVALEKSVCQKRYSMLIFSSFLVFFSNFYFAYKIVVIGGIYICIFYFNYNKYKKEKTKEILYTLIRMFVSGIVGVMMSAIFLFPTIISFLEVQRIGTEKIHIGYGKEYYLEILRNLVIYGDINWATIGSSIFCVFVVIIILFQWRKYKNELSIMIVMSCVLVIPQLGSAMNGFSYPTNRWTFAFCFWMSYLVAVSIKEIKGLNRKKYIILGMGVSGYCLFLMNYFFGESRLVILFCIIYYFLVYACLKMKKNKGAEIVLCGMIILSSILNTRVMLYKGEIPLYDSYLTRDEISNKYNSADGKLEHMDRAVYEIEKDKSPYRISTAKKNVPNLPLYLQYNGTSSYLSLVSGNVSRWSYDLDNLEYNTSNPTGDMDARTKILNILGVKYYVAMWENAIIPYGFEPYLHIGDLHVYRNTMPSSMALFYSDIKSDKMYEKMSGIERENALLETAFVDDSYKGEVKDIVQNEDLNDEISYDVSENSELRIVDGKINVTAAGQKLILKTDVIKDKELYVQLSELECSGADGNNAFTVKVASGGRENWKNVEDREISQYYCKFDRLIFNLGYSSDERSEIAISFSAPGIYAVSDIKVFGNSFDNLESLLQKLQKPIRKLEIKGNRVEIKYQSETEGIIQIPTGYSKGWKAEIDGKEAQVINVNNGLLGIHVPKGSEKLVVEYSIPHMKLWILITIIGWLMFWLGSCFEKHIELVRQ